MMIDFTLTWAGVEPLHGQMTFALSVLEEMVVANEELTKQFIDAGGLRIKIDDESDIPVHVKVWLEGLSPEDSDKLMAFYHTHARRLQGTPNPKQALLDQLRHGLGNEN